MFSSGPANFAYGRVHGGEAAAMRGRRCLGQERGEPRLAHTIGAILARASNAVHAEPEASGARGTHFLLRGRPAFAMLG